MRTRILVTAVCLAIAFLLLLMSGCGSTDYEAGRDAGTEPLTATFPGGPTVPSGGPETASPFGFHPVKITQRGYADNGLTDALNIGVGWAREPVYAFWFKVQPDLAVAEYDFSFYDVQWGQLPPQISIMGNIAPQGPTDMGRCLPDTWIPVDEQAYAAFVRATVERYDGDGVADMPGLANPIRYWQPGNEPKFQRPSGFATLQRLTYEAVKQACAECQVIIGGVPGQPQDYIRMFDENYAPILAELQGKYVDIMDFHWYGESRGDYRLKDPGTGEDVLKHIRQTLAANGFPGSMPVWITEMGAYSGDPLPGGRDRDGDGVADAGGPPAGNQISFKDFPAQSERQQAGDYFRRFIYPVSLGVEKVFGAFGIMEGFKHNDGYFDHTGIIYNGEGPGDPGLGVKKLAYYMYKQMSEQLAGADWATLETLHDGTSGDHLYLFRISKDGQPLYIAWWDYFDEPGYAPGATRNLTISGVEEDSMQVVSVVPEQAGGAAVSAAGPAFASAVVPVSDGTAELTLAEDPLIARPVRQS